MTRREPVPTANGDPGPSSAGHTPGPWRALDTDFNLDIRAAVAGNLPGCGLSLKCVLGPGSRSIAHVDAIYDGKRQLDVEEANASLIAAAPDLLAALKSLAASYEAVAKTSVLERIGEVSHPDLDTANAAIAKAQGKTP